MPVPREETLVNAVAVKPLNTRPISFPRVRWPPLLIVAPQGG